MPVDSRAILESHVIAQELLRDASVCPRSSDWTVLLGFSSILLASSQVALLCVERCGDDGTVTGRVGEDNRDLRGGAQTWRRKGNQS